MSTTTIRYRTTTTEEIEFEVDSVETLFMSIFFVVLGSVSALLNILNIITYSNKNLRRKYMYQISLEIFDFVDSISYILTGIGRGSALLGGYMGVITVHDCFFKTYWVHSLILGMELPCYMVILMSIERICAATRPALYRSLFTTGTKMRFVGVVVFLSLIAYASFHFLVVIFAYIISFTSLVTVYCFTVNAKTSQTEKVRKLTIMISITGSSIILVSMPSIVMLGIKYNIWTVHDSIVAVTYGMPGMLTIVNTLINLSFRRDFREVFYSIFCCNLLHTPHNSVIVYVGKTSLRGLQTHY